MGKLYLSLPGDERDTERRLYPRNRKKFFMGRAEGST